MTVELSVHELRAAVEEFFADGTAVSETRAIADGVADRWDDRRWGLLSGDLGVGGLVVPPGFGGLGLSAHHAAVVVEIAGGAVSPAPVRSTLLGLLLLRAGGRGRASSGASPSIDCLTDAVSAEMVRELYVGVAERSEVVAVAVRPGDAVAVRPGDAVAVLDGGSGPGVRVSADLPAVPDVIGAHHLLLVADDGHLLRVDPCGTGCRLESVASMDPGRGHARVLLDHVRATVVGRMSSRSHAADLASVLVAAEQLGVARACARAGAAYARERVQFGRPIGVNQAISHRLATDVVAVEKASALAQRAVAAADRCIPDDSGGLQGPDGTETLPAWAPLAAAAAARAATAGAATLVQVLGGIGFTWEHDAQFWFRRSRALGAWEGPPERLDEQAVRRGAVGLVRAVG
ncbi:acyl-CoA dehydrogenase family protein [Gordonia soli]|uniref:Putative acyl-CoA dehydrogenase n=1 Tax=Gordonia soli NBRC 108243 TaxID=1223545 RepID=M0QFM2_9ACTN|nr:acyl-CoA dehydrogenase family protein [Gordonia soli]GAC66212.1 putative acyl-CoA dehydrogenase [Gordonia soli NBRC 108243]